MAEIVFSDYDGDTQVKEILIKLIFENDHFLALAGPLNTESASVLWPKPAQGGARP